MAEETYLSPLSTRYASAAMRRLFSAEHRARLWRRLWIELAQAEHELGLPITQAQLDELRATEGRIDLERVREHERRLRHDVMAHVHAWGELCPGARPILHLGATSCYVTDNADLVILREALELLRAQLVGTIARLADFARRWRSLPTLGLTHLQPAQATTVGKRASLWLQDFLHDLEDLEHARSRIRFRGVKGTTGTQASFLALFEGAHEKVEALDRLVTERMGFERCFAVTGQTYPRRMDHRVAQALSGIAQSAHKMAVDLRLLASRRELEEPFEKDQIGSSAMPWKRNPMRSERICSLARLAIGLAEQTAHTAAHQWLERTLDDSANRRIVLAELCLSVDAILQLCLDVSAGLVVHEAVVRQNLARELPFLASEALMMEAVRGGADRQDVHEALRRASREAARAIHEGGENPLRELLLADPVLGSLAPRLEQVLAPERHVGRSPEQVLAFLAAEVEPVLARWRHLAATEGRVEV